MMLFCRKLSLMTLVLACLLVFSGCAGKVSPLYLDPSFSDNRVDNLTILPLVDLREDKTLTLDKYLGMKGGGCPGLHNLNPSPSRETLKKCFGKKGYDVALPDDYGGAGEISADDIINADQAWIKKLGPEDARWVMLLAVEDNDSKVTLGNLATGMILGVGLVMTGGTSAGCSGALFDKETNSVVWKHKDTTNLATLHIVGEQSNFTEAASFCLGRLYKEFPSNK